MFPRVFLILAFLLLAPALCRAQQLVVTPDRETGVYAVGDSVRWTARWKGATAAPPAARYTVKSGGLREVGSGDLAFAGNVATMESKFDAPGTMLVEVKWSNGSSDSRAFAGAVAAPEKI